MVFLWRFKMCDEELEYLVFTLKDVIDDLLRRNKTLRVDIDNLEHEVAHLKNSLQLNATNQKPF